MKKLMALCLSLLMVLSMCSFTAMAEGEVLFSEIADGQPQNFVYKNLVLGGHTITSSNEAVIAADGTVTRPYLKDEVVTITIDGESACNVTVKAMTADVKDAYDFATDGVIAEDAYAAWTRTQGTNTENDALVANGKLNLVISSDTDTYDRTNIQYNLPAPTGDRPVVIKFKTGDYANITSAGADIRLNADMFNADGVKVGTIGAVTLARISDTGFGSYLFQTRSKEVTIKYNPSNCDYWGNSVSASNICVPNDSNAGSYSWSDKEDGSGEKYTSDDVETVVFTGIRFTNAAGGCGADFSIDDFAVYEEYTEEEILATYPEAQVEYYSRYLSEDYIANGKSLDMVTEDLVFTADEALPDGTTLTWETTDEAVVATDGTITRDYVGYKSATITGTLAIAGIDPVVKSYDVTVAPMTIGGTSEKLGFESGFDNTGWSVKDSAVAYNSADGNGYIDITSTAGYLQNDALKYDFRALPEVDSSTEAIVLSYDFKQNASPATMHNVGFKLNEVAVGEYIGRFNNTFHGQDWTPGQAWYGGVTTGYITTPAEFVNIKIRANIKDNLVEYYVNDELKFSTALPAVDLTSLSSAWFYVEARSSEAAPTDISVDNIMLYSEKSLTGVIAGLDDADKVDLYKSAIENTEIPAVVAIGDAYDLDAGYTDFGDTGVTVSWGSRNPEYIANDGKLVKFAPIGSDYKVAMTAVITSGAAQETAIVEIPVSNGTTLVASGSFNSEPDGVLEIVATNPSKSTSVDTGVNGVNHATVGHTDRVVIEADINFTHDAELDSNGGGILVNGIQSAEAASVLFDFRNARIQVLMSDAGVNPGGNTLGTMYQGSRNIPMPEELQDKEGQWIHVAIDYNILSNTYDVYADGILLTQAPVIVANTYKPNTSGSAIRGIKGTVSAAGNLKLDNVKISKFADAEAIEVNAALKAAAAVYGSELVDPELTNCTLPSKTLSLAWTGKTESGSEYTFYIDDVANMQNNPGLFVWQTDDPDAPVITYAINGEAVTEINVTRPETVEFTITATKGDVSESRTFTRKLAPVTIKYCGLNGYNFNGLWLKGATGTEKLVTAEYFEGKLVCAKVFDLDDPDALALLGETTSYNAETGLLAGVGVLLPGGREDVDTVKVFIMKDGGLFPVSYIKTF